MKFLILEARKKNSILFLTGCFHPDNDNKYDVEDLETMVKTAQENNYDSYENITLEQGTIFIRNVTYSSLATILKTLSSNIDFSLKPAKKIKYIGNINDDGLKRALSSMLDGWSVNKTV